MWLTWSFVCVCALHCVFVSLFGVWDCVCFQLCQFVIEAHWGMGWWFHNRLALEKQHVFFNVICSLLAILKYVWPACFSAGWSSWWVRRRSTSSAWLRSTILVTACWNALTSNLVSAFLTVATQLSIYTNSPAYPLKKVSSLFICYYLFIYHNFVW